MLSLQGAQKSLIDEFKKIIFTSFLRLKGVNEGVAKHAGPDVADTFFLSGSCYLGGLQEVNTS